MLEKREMRRRTSGPHWIEHPHFLDREEYECSQCGKRQKKMTPACLNCKAVMTGRKTTDTREWEEEEEFDWLIGDEE